MIECHIKNTCYIDDSRVRLLVLECLKTGAPITCNIWGNTMHLPKGRTQCRRLPALCGVWGRVVFKPQALSTQMCRGWGSNPGPSGYRR